MYRIKKTNIENCIEIFPNVFEDNRGITIKPYHRKSFEDLGILEEFKEDLFVTSSKGVIRGLHFQKEPFEQSKLIYCVKGSILDVAIDMRKESKTYGQAVHFHIDSRKRNMAYIPSGFAHGYEVLEEDTMVVYKLSSMYAPEYEEGIRWDSVNIDWNTSNPLLSDKDKKWQTFLEYTNSSLE